MPAAQTAAPVRVGDVLAALQSDTRADLQTLLGETATGSVAARPQSLNRGAPFVEPALRDLAVSADAALGRASRARTSGAGCRHRSHGGARSAADEAALKGLVTDLDVVAGALAAEDAALSASIPALRDTLRAARPALAALNDDAA